MPYYNWINHNTEEKIEVLRRIHDVAVPPSVEEMQVPDPSPDWERLMPSNTTWVQAAGYRAGGKGSRGGYRAKTSLNREKTG